MSWYYGYQIPRLTDDDHDAVQRLYWIEGTKEFDEWMETINDIRLLPMTNGKDDR